ncbi:MAG TPA: class I tRNA ligase family protein, partial [Thermoanaerobaculia bacterium]|nr:class I tRNA ligase family protein [Thermoanaerobaculia bacterium]
EFHAVYHRVLELCTTDLSAIYLDASKDTMYCDGPTSPERRSAQTAMYHVLRGITTVIAPILSFTADEIYEAMPGEKKASVHLDEIPKMEPLLSADEAASWAQLLKLREAVMPVLEKARAAKQIGQSLEADVAIAGRVPETGVDLAKFFIVSHADVTPSDAETADVSWAPARGKKCGRCWQYREEVAEDGDLCTRCQEVVDTLAPTELPTA